MWEKILRNDWHIRMADSILSRDTQVHVKWEYDDGVVLQGMAAIYDLTGEARYLRYIQALMDSFVLDDGQSIRGYSPDEYNIDHINNGKILLYLHEKTGEARYLRAAKLLMSQLQSHPRTQEGAFWHKQIYPYQVWLDGLYMGSPFYAHYAADYLGPDALDDVALQFRICFKHTLDMRTGLHYHAWDEKHTQFWCDPETGCSKHFWARAMGWFCAALVDVLDSFPATHPARPEIEAYFRACADTVLAVQDVNTNVWFQILDQNTRPGNYLEASASCLFVYALAKAVRTGLLPSSYWQRITQAYDGIITQFVEVYKGLVNLNKCCQVAGLGNTDARDGSFAYYISEPIICNDRKGIGAFLQAAVEVEGYGKNHIISPLASSETDPASPPHTF